MHARRATPLRGAVAPGRKPQPASAPAARAASAEPATRQPPCACGGGCPRCRTASAWPLLGHPGSAAEHEAQQRAAAPGFGAALAGAAQHRPQAAQGGEHAPASVPQTLQQPGVPLPGPLRQHFERQRGQDFSQVRLHTGVAAAQSAADVQALAYTVGHDIVLGSRVGRLDTERGRHLLAHELTHVQQAAAAGGQAPVLQRATDVHAELTGHASPAWAHPRAGDRAALNLRLSQDRVEAVRGFFEDMFRAAMHARGLAVDFVYETRAVDDPAAVPDPTAPDTTSLDVDAHGSRDTEREADGDLAADAPEMRRVDLRVTVVWQALEDAPSSASVVTTTPETCEDNATRRWSISLGLTLSAHDVLGGSLVIGRLWNRRTGQSAAGVFIGGGVGAGVLSPVDLPPGLPSGDLGGRVDFTTERPVTFDDFDMTAAWMTGVSASAGVGAGVGYFSFPQLGSSLIETSGLSLGSLGLEASLDVGAWNVLGTPPGPRCTPASTETRGVVRHRTAVTAVPEVFTHRIHFETGSAALSDPALQGLQAFVDAVVAQREDTTPP